MENLSTAKHTAAIATGVTLGLTVIKAVAGLISGSSALSADSLHSLIDGVALGGSYFGLTISQKAPNRRFPYGYYRAESLAAFLISLLIIFMGGQLLLNGIHRIKTVHRLEIPFVAMGIAGLSMLVSWTLSRWEKRVSYVTGSQSLSTIADEAKVDVMTSGLVFVAVFSSFLGIGWIEALITIFIAGIVIWTGIKNTLHSLLSIMDASLDANLEESIKIELEKIPGVKKCPLIKCRQSGPFYFAEGEIQVGPAMDVSRSHSLVHNAETHIRNTFPRIERLILHVEPFHANALNVAIPIKNNKGLDSEVEDHFGRSSEFLLALIKDGMIKEWKVLENPYHSISVQAGLATIKWLSRELNIDAVFVKDIGEIAFHTLRDNYIELFKAEGATAKNILNTFLKGQIPYLQAPTHESDEKHRF